MSSGRATVSVIVTTKNSERTLEPCLQSIRRQTYQAIELLVVDNHSVDLTFAIAARYTDSVIIAGPERCTQRNIGVERATGEFILIVDSDMYLRPDVVERCLEAMDGSIAGAIIPEESIGEGFWAKCKAFERDFYRDDMIVGAARFFRRDAYLRAGGFDESLVSGEDWDLSMRIERLGKIVIAKTLIQHDEGRLRLGALMEKKFYYGSHIRKFIRKNGSDAIARLNPMRSSYGRFFNRFAKQPMLAAGMIAMRMCEVMAGGAGLLLSYFRPL